MRKLQSSIEFLLTYSWAFLAIAVFLAFLLAVVTVRNPASLTPGSCYINTRLLCRTSVFMTNTAASAFILIFKNNLGRAISFPESNGITMNPTFSGLIYNGVCLPYNAPIGSVVTCNVTAPKQLASVGAQISPKFTLNYELCHSDGCDFPIVPQNLLYTSGFSTMEVSPMVPNAIVLAGLQTLPVGGEIVLNSVVYPSNVLVHLLYGYPYTVYALPPSSYFFSSWATTGGVSVSPATTQNAIVNAISPGNIIAVFYSTTTTSTITSTSTSSTTTSLTSTSTTSTTSTSTTSSTTSSTSTTTAPLGLDKYGDSGLACCSPPTNPSTNVVTFTGITTTYSDELVLVMSDQAGEPIESVTDSQGQLTFSQYGTSVDPTVYYAIVPGTLTNDQVSVTYGPLSGLIDDQVSLSLWSGENTVTPFDTNSKIPNTMSMAATSRSFNAFAYYTTSNANDILISAITPSHLWDNFKFPSGYTKITGSVSTGNILYVSYNVVSAIQASANTPKTLVFYCPSYKDKTCKYVPTSQEPTAGGSDGWVDFAVAIQGFP
ncbi:MAG: hypothetical protein KGH52_00265 [Candidatus Micrarchaeota archaeon]|nr:hypothetical protein [Candidatus Micrarchaeota archaeon]